MQLSFAPRSGAFAEMQSEWPALAGAAVQRPIPGAWGSARVPPPGVPPPPPGLENAKEERRSSDAMSDGGAFSETTYQPASDSDVSDTESESVAFSVAENALTSPPESSKLSVNAFVFVPRGDLDAAPGPSLSAKATPFVPVAVLSSLPPPPGLRTALSTKARVYNPIAGIP